MDKSDVLPRRRLSASKAAASFAHQLNSDGSSDLEGLDVTTVVDKLSASARKERAEVKTQYGKKAKLRAKASSMKASTSNVQYAPSSSDAVLSTSLLVSQQPGPSSTENKGMVLYLSTDPSNLMTEDDLSDLTSLSSSTRSSSPDITGPSDNDVSQISLCLPPPKLSELEETAWSVNDLDSYVWVLLEPKSKRVYDSDRDKNDGKERLWWPAKIQSPKKTDIPLKVSLFGIASKKLDILTPFAGNVLSKLDVIGRPRFIKPTFTSTPSILSNATIVPSRRKKLKRDRGELEKKWEAAVRKMVQDGEEQAGSDHLPDIGEAFNYHFDATSSTTVVTAHVEIPTNMGKGKGKGKRKRSYDDNEDFEPPPADGGLDIPGELILGRDRTPKSAAYWPGKIKSYVPPAKRTEQGKYTVIWLDGSEQEIPRDWFYTMDEDGFALCTLGKFESSVPEVLNDDDSDDDLRLSASPVTIDPPPNNDDFSVLPIREQFVYTKNVLRAILNDEYEPARSKHSRFMKGGKQRASLTDEAALRGRMNPKDIEHLQTYIREWCLREEAPANIFIDEIKNHVDGNNHLGTMKDIREEVKEPSLNGSFALMEPKFLSSPPQVPPSSSCPSVTLRSEASLISDESLILPDVPPSALEPEDPPRCQSILGETTLGSIDVPIIYVKTRPAKQQGCKEYELLSHFDKIEYCLNVLLPEAVRQILLWRSGKRTSIELLSSAEEEDLYQEGQTLLNETDWVFDILRYRQMKRRMLQPGIPKGKNGTISRPSRSLHAS